MCLRGNDLFDYIRCFSDGIDPRLGRIWGASGCLDHDRVLADIDPGANEGVGDIGQSARSAVA